ncbi:hypothetical protein QBC44DRAFT_13958 [Cladorrhinum sp. PSN332]|nr:hypothetical protein QBC44DRAFT_13958 [Cladorrhinum sp. PSN332]
MGWMVWTLGSGDQQSVYWHFLVVGFLYLALRMAGGCGKGRFFSLNYHENDIFPLWFPPFLVVCRGSKRACFGQSWKLYIPTHPITCYLLRCYQVCS